MQTSLWSPQYLIHDTEIDRQHQVLFEIANGLYEAMLLGRGKEIFAEVLAKVRTLWSAHHAYEERLMKDTHYPEYREHIRQHEELGHSICFFSERSACGENTMTIELALFISTTVRQHIMTTDRRLAEYLNARSSAPLFDGSVGRCDTQRSGMKQGHRVML
jgi:hemerythrin